MRDWRAANSDRQRAADRDYYHRTKSSSRAVTAARKYGITVDQAQEAILVEECEICHRLGPMMIDHDHDARTARGVICRACNLAIGQLDDDAERAQAVADYLRAGGFGRFSR